MLAQFFDPMWLSLLMQKYMLSFLHLTFSFHAKKYCSIYKMIPSKWVSFCRFVKATPILHAWLSLKLTEKLSKGEEVTKQFKNKQR